MEDYNSNLLNDSKNEWCIRLTNIISGHIIDGFRSIFTESIEICEKNDEPEKYLMTFQNFLSMIPKWNQNIIDKEVDRIKESSKCKYLEDLITCVHIIQLKILSCVRTSSLNKKIDIDIPCFKSFLHVVYINIARKLYSNIYLFQIDVTQLEQQKNNREFEIIVQTCIMNTIRDNIPVEDLLKQYIDETQENDVVQTEKIIDESQLNNNIPIKTENDPIQSVSTVVTDESDSSVNSSNFSSDIITPVIESSLTVDNTTTDPDSSSSITIVDPGAFPENNDSLSEINDSLSENKVLFKDTENNNDNEELQIGNSISLENDSIEEINLDVENLDKVNDAEINLDIEELSL